MVRSYYRVGYTFVKEGFEMNALISLLSMRLSFATATSQNLFDKAWTEGNLYEIQPVVNVLGTFACWVISIVGFGIVIFSILKNAFSGLYVVNPAFWDKVSDVKAQAVTGAQKTIGDATKGGNAAVQKLGGLFVFLLGLIPNVKALTDFEDEAPVDKKQYFMRSIPLLVAQIFIGMLIVQGWPAKLANWIGTGATYAIGAVINNVDPVQVVLNLSDAFITFNLRTDGSLDPREQTINKMAADMTKTVQTRYDDMHKDSVQQTANYIEEKLITEFKGDRVTAAVGAAEGYKISVSVMSQSNVPAVSESYQKDEGSNVWYAQATNGTYSFKYWISGSELPTGSTKVSDNDYFVWTVMATPVAVSNVATANLIPCGSIVSMPTIEGNSDTARVHITSMTFGNGQEDIKGSYGSTVTIDIVVAGNPGDSNINYMDANNAPVTNGVAGSVVTTLNGRLEVPTVMSGENMGGYISMSKSEASKLCNYLNNNASSQALYARVRLTGNWSYSCVTDGGKSTTTLNVKELRLASGVSQTKYLISSWNDVSVSTHPSKGVDKLDGDVLKRQSLSTSE